MIDVSDNLPAGIAHQASRELTSEMLDELRQAAAVAEAFVKVVKGYRYYPAEYPLHREFKRDLFDRLFGYLEQHYSLHLHVSELAFLFEGHAIYSTNELKSSIPFLLYRDGIREILFLEGIEEEEVLAFIEILTICDKTDRLEDDLVTLLWERELTHIQYLAVDDFLDRPEEIPESAEALRNRLLHLDAHAPPLDALWDDAHLPTGEDAPAQLVESLLNDSAIYRLTPEEMEALQREVAQDEGAIGAMTRAATLFDLLACEKDRVLFEQLAAAVHALLTRFLEAGYFHLAGEVLTRTSAVLQDFPAVDWRASLLQKIITAMGQPAALQSIERHLRVADNARLAALPGLLGRLPTSTVPQLVRLLGEIPDRKARMILCDALAQIIGSDAHLLAPFLGDARSELVVDLVAILERSRHANIISYLAHALQHRSPQVRRAVVRALSGLTHDHAERLLIKALADADELVRVQAATHLGNRRTPSACAILLQLVHEKGFDARSPIEVRAVLQAVGRTGSNAALDALQRLLLRKSWFDRRHADALRQHAAHAIALIGTPEAQAILRRGQEDRDITIRQACTLALKALPKEPHA